MDSEDGKISKFVYMVDYDSDGYEPSFQLQVRDILSNDDRDKFFSFLRYKNAKGPLSFYIVHSIFASGAVKCAKALLEEETDYTFDIHGSLFDRVEDYTPLHFSSSSGNIEMVRLLLRHGAQPNIRITSFHPCDQLHKRIHNKLPLNLALQGLNTVIGNMCDYDWNPAAHIFSVVIILCLPTLRNRLKVLRLLVERTEEVEKEISHYVIEGKVVELAALLLVAPEKVMSPSVFENLGCTKLEGGMTFGNLLMQKIMTTKDLKLSSVANGNHKLARKSEHQLASLMPMFQLLGIFESVGDRIQTYLQEEPQVFDQNVAAEVASILLDAGFPIKEEDYNLSMMSWWSDSMADLEYLLWESREGVAEERKIPAKRRGKLEVLKLGQVTLAPISKHTPQNPAARSFSCSLVSMAVRDPSCNQDKQQSLIVELEKLRKHEYLNDWNPRKSIFKLIYILCLPELQGGLLKRIRLLALESEDVGKLSCLCLKEGNVIELAVLLMVARERLIGKTTHSGGASHSDNSMELHKCLMDEMSSAIYEETLSLATFRSSNLVQSCKARIKLMSSARWLLEVFERAGYCIDLYLQSEVYFGATSNAQVAIHVAYLLQEKGFLLRRQDLNLCEIKCFSAKLELECKRAEKLSELSKRFPVTDVATRLCSPAHVFSLAEKKHITGMLSGQQRTFPIFGSAARSFHTTCIPNSSFGFMTSVPTGTQTMKMVKPLMGNFLSGEQLTMLALAFKRGIKRI